MSYLEVVASSIFFQFSLYVCARLAHRGFTFGELGLVAFGATVLFMESFNLTMVKVRVIGLMSAFCSFSAHALMISSGRPRYHTSRRSGFPLHYSFTSLRSYPDPFLPDSSSLLCSISRGTSPNDPSAVYGIHKRSRNTAACSL